MKILWKYFRVLACVLSLILICLIYNTSKASGVWIWPFESRTLSRDFSTHGYEGIDVAVSENSEIRAPVDAKIVYIFNGCNHHSGLTYGVTCENAGGCTSGAYSRDLNKDGSRSFTWGYCNHGFGNGIVLYSEEENLTIQFAHMNRLADAFINGTYKEGMVIPQKTLLGFVGDTGTADGVHCHFAVSQGKKYYENFIDPMSMYEGIQLWAIDENSNWNGIAKFWAKRKDDDGNHYARFYIDDVPITGNISSDNNGFFSVNVDTTQYTDGLHQLSIYYANTSGGWWDLRHIYFNTSTPGKADILLWGIEENQAFSGTVKFWAKRTDSDSNHYAVFYLDDVPITGNLSSDEAGYFSVEIDTQNYTDGNHQLSIYYANSTSGNWDVRIIELKNVIKLQNIENNSTWNKTVRIQAKRFDNDDNHYAIFYLDDVPITGHISADSKGFFMTEIDTTLYTNDVHKISIYYACTTHGAWDTRYIIFENTFEEPDFILPYDIIKIEESAFEGISASVVYISDNCTSIGKWAFRNCSNLTQIRIPADCDIGTDAFINCNHVVIFGTKGSKAEIYANSHTNCTFLEE